MTTCAEEDLHGNASLRLMQGITSCDILKTVVLKILPYIIMITASVNHDSCDFQFNSDYIIEPTFGSISTAINILQVIMP